jgi:hypothetical protein
MLIEGNGLVSRSNDGFQASPFEARFEVVEQIADKGLVRLPCGELDRKVEEALVGLVDQRMKAIRLEAHLGRLPVKWVVRGEVDREFIDPSRVVSSMYKQRPAPVCDLRLVVCFISRYI